VRRSRLNYRPSSAGCSHSAGCSRSEGPREGSNGSKSPRHPLIVEAVKLLKVQPP
jgi:hypothetical protein